MPRLTITITDEQAELLEEKTGDGAEYEPKSEAVRHFITEYERLTERVGELQQEQDHLERKLTATNTRIDEVTELVETSTSSESSSATVSAVSDYSIKPVCSLERSGGSPASRSTSSRTTPTSLRRAPTTEPRLIKRTMRFEVVPVLSRSPTTTYTSMTPSTTETWGGV
ncbi:hypothetical protein [Natronococcus sp. JC468]|uniref:hypothetical protein n=1 Tax=Natronococcus sp. JC468 TaxID=1961921 RepID=UPI001FD774A3|nr:hypothetical protein [Natronococcus sp. JC468]